jgi:ubiquinone/menaquinone biosynthesis C-methylase UbiE
LVAAAPAINIDFRTATAEALPFSDASFDAVLGTTILHCLPDAARRLMLRHERLNSRDGSHRSPL